MGTNHAETLARVAAVIFGISLGASPAQAEIGVNMIANPSFEKAEGDLPAGWRITRAGQEDPPAVEYPDASAPGADGTLDPSTGDRYVRFVNAPHASNMNTVFEQGDSQGNYEWIPIQPGIPYRFRMQYRFDEVLPETGGNARVDLRIVFGYDANPGGVPEPTSFSYGELHYARIHTHCCGEPPVVTENWRLVQTDLIFDGTPVVSGGVEREIEWIRLRMEPFTSFYGTVSVDDLSMVELANAEFSGPESSRAYDFVARTCAFNSANKFQACVSDDDCPGADANNDGVPDGESVCVEGSPTAGFTAVPFNRSFSSEGEYGFDFEEGSNPPTGYDRDTFPTQFAARHLNRNATFKTALPDGEYRVSLYMGGYWRNDPGPEVHIVDFNGETLVDESGYWVDNDALKDHWYFRNVEATLVTSEDIASTGRGYAVYRDYIAPRYRRHDQTVEVTNGEGLEIVNRNGFMAGVVITPTSEQAAHESAIEAFEVGLADEFVSHFATYVPPAEFGLPVVQGEAETPAGGPGPEYVIFRRHWMDFVEFTSRPDPDEPAVTELSLAATPGEFEPATFSIWPQQQLENATITVGDLQTAGGTATIPADAVSVWYLQQKPWRDQTEFSFIGTFLPDWGSRTLYPDVTQRAWLNVKVPEDAPAGLYTGQVTFAAEGAAPTILDLKLEVRPFVLERPQRVHVQRGAGGKLILAFPSEGFDDSEGAPLQPHNREFYRRAAYEDLHDHGFQPEIDPWFDGSISGGVWWDENGDFVWSQGDISGSADDQLARFDASPFSDGGVAWIDGSIGRAIDAFLSNGSGEWSPADVAQWLAGIESKLYGDRGISTIYLHATSEESHYTGSTWTDFLDFVRDHRDDGYGGSGAWPHVYTVHTSNTTSGQPEAIAHADFPLLGMFHGVGTPKPSEQIAAAKATGKPFGLYGMRGRFGPGFYMWKAGASGSFHEFYSPYSGTLNDDWEESSRPHENPGWTSATYSPSGRMIGSWYWEELREGVDDDAYLSTLDHWIARARCDQSLFEACASAVATRQAIFDAIDLDVYSNEEDFEELGISGRLSRTGLELYRPMQPPTFDALRSQVAVVIAALVGPDSDGDEVPDHLDNCSELANPIQEDTDADGTGDACNSAEDADGDEFSDTLDNCPSDPNPDQADADGNGTGDACNSAEDADGDEFSDTLDNCPNVWNPTQADLCAGTSVPTLSPMSIGVLISVLVGLGVHARRALSGSEDSRHRGRFV